MSDDHLTLRIEAVLMTADRPLGERKLASILQLDGRMTDAADGDDSSRRRDDAEPVAEPADGEVVVADDADATAGSPVTRIRDAVEALNADYEATGRSFRIERVAGGLQMLTLPAYAEDITRLKGARQSSKLSQAALETLAIIAYRQPILRADLESIRGVACGEVLRSLMERRLVRIAGRAEEVGRPMLYGTTKEFLEVFGLATLDDLPNAKDLRPVVAQKTTGKTTETPKDEVARDEIAGDAVEDDVPGERVPNPEPSDPEPTEIAAEAVAGDDDRHD